MIPALVGQVKSTNNVMANSAKHLPGNLKVELRFDFFVSAIGNENVKKVEVAVGVILRGNQIYISKRADELHQGGKWEFPGGKRESSETMSEALSRELREEIGIEVTQESPMMVIEHDYGDKQVCLDIRLVEGFIGEPEHKEGQISQWVLIDELDNFQFPEANKPIVEMLQQKHRIQLN